MNSRNFKLYRAYSISFNSSNVGKFGLFQTSRKLGKETCCLVFPSSTIVEIRHFHVAVVQRRLRSVEKSVMHVPSCYFANLNLLFFCRCCRLCLSSLWCPREAGKMDYCYFCWNTQWEPPGRRRTGLFSKSNLVVCCHGLGAKEWEWTQSFVWRVEIRTIRWV